MLLPHPCGGRHPVGERIATARKTAGYATQDDLAAALGVARSMVGLIEGGRRQIPLLKVHLLSRLVKVPAEELLPEGAVDRQQLRALELLERAPQAERDRVLDILEQLVGLTRR